MKRMKWMLVLASVLLLCLAGCAEKKPAASREREAHPVLSETLFQAQPETVTYPLESGEPLKVLLPLSYDGENAKGAFYQDLQEATGVELDITFLPEAEIMDNLYRSLSSGDVPDLLWGLNPYWLSFNEDMCEDLLPLEDYIRTDCPNYLSWLKRDQETMASVLPDGGSVYLFYTLWESPVNAVYHGPVVRQDLLDQYGLTRPETYGDWENVLLTLKDQVEEPLTIDYYALSGANFLCAGYDVSLAMESRDQGFYQVDGTVKYGPLEPGFTDCVTMLRSWFDQGIITNRFLDFRDPGSSEYLLQMANGESAIFFLWYDKVRSMETVSEIEGFQAALLPDPVQEPGQVTHLCEDAGETVYQPTFAISATCAQPERAVRFVDYLYSEEGIRLCCMGREGGTYTLSGGKPVFTEAALQDNQLLQEHTCLTITGVLLEQEVQRTMDPRFTETQAVWMSRKDGEYHLPVNLYEKNFKDENEDLGALIADINTYAEQQLLMLITAQTPLEEIPNIQAKLRDMGAEDCVAMVQRRVDDFYSR